ncbi:MAG: ThuA domain-containing protein [Bacteroidota bacterium]
MIQRLLTFSFFLFFSLTAAAQIKVLIVDGQNNHVVWPKSTIMMRQYLEDTGLFTVDVARTMTTWRGTKEAEYLPLAGVEITVDQENPETDPDFKPKFKRYDVVISNFGWKAAAWPEKTQKRFEKFVAKGGGFVVVHAADNSFPEWSAYNEMIGLGGWGGRNQSAGPYVYYNDAGELVRDTSPGGAGAHGAYHEFPITIREPNHPIVKGMPTEWLSTGDECYAKLRGPAKNLTVLATGKDLSPKAPTDRHEPMLMTIEYGKGRVFHTTLGHDAGSFEGVGFIVSLLRGVEWAGTGRVTQPVPEDFPTAKEATKRSFTLKR